MVLQQIKPNKSKNPLLCVTSHEGVHGDESNGKGKEVVLMTRNQIAYQELLEKGRSNRAQEVETNRANVAKETELNRHQLATEKELNRHQLETEAQGREQNAETARTNRAKEALTKYSTDVGAEQKHLDRLNQAQIASANRAATQSIADKDRALKDTLGRWAQDLNEYIAYDQTTLRDTERALNKAKTEQTQEAVKREQEKSGREERRLQADILKMMNEAELATYDRNPIVRFGDAFTKLVPSVNYKIGGSVR